MNDNAAKFNRALAGFIFAPIGVLAILHGRWDVGAFAMATAACFVGLSNHE